MDNLNASIVAALRVPLPSLAQQQLIAHKVAADTRKIDNLIGEGQRLIELAQERRAALITAAVTGQFDVRETA
jgi:type I restriction enzyme S subunit